MTVRMARHDDVVIAYEAEAHPTASRSSTGHPMHERPVGTCPPRRPIQRR
jgi:hypothetical protein